MQKKIVLVLLSIKVKKLNERFKNKNKKTMEKSK